MCWVGPSLSDHGGRLSPAVSVRLKGLEETVSLPTSARCVSECLPFHLCACARNEAARGQVGPAWRISGQVENEVWTGSTGAHVGSSGWVGLLDYIGLFGAVFASPRATF